MSKKKIIVYHYKPSRIKSRAKIAEIVLEDDEIIETASYPQYYVKVENEEANDE